MVHAARDPERRVSDVRADATDDGLGRRGASGVALQQRGTRTGHCSRCSSREVARHEGARRRRRRPSAAAAAAAATTTTTTRRSRRVEGRLPDIKVKPSAKTKATRALSPRRRRRRRGSGGTKPRRVSSRRKRRRRRRGGDGGDDAMAAVRRYGWLGRRLGRLGRWFPTPPGGSGGGSGGRAAREARRAGEQPRGEAEKWRRRADSISACERADGRPAAKRRSTLFSLRWQPSADDFHRRVIARSPKTNACFSRRRPRAPRGSVGCSLEGFSPGVARHA